MTGRDYGPSLASLEGAITGGATLRGGRRPDGAWWVAIVVGDGAEKTRATARSLMGALEALDRDLAPVSAR